MPSPAKPWLYALVLVLPAAFLLTLAVNRRSPGDPTTEPRPRELAEWNERHAALVATARKGGVDVLFLGDSITRGWESAGAEVWNARFGRWRPANFGIDGDGTQHVLWRITEGHELDGIDPKVVVLLVGTNNLGAGTPDRIAGAVGTIIAGLRTQKPGAGVLLLGVLPKVRGPVPAADRVPAEALDPGVKEVNTRIAKFDDGRAVRYLDAGGGFLDGTGGLSRDVMYDFVHPTTKGYTILADAIEKPVGELLVGRRP